MKTEGIKFHLPAPESLTTEQKNLITLDLSDPKRKGWGENLIVKGYGGTGKTVVAYYRALGWKQNAYKHYTGKGDKVLFICFNKLLNSQLRSETDYPVNCEVLYLQEFYDRIRNLLRDKIKVNGSINFNKGNFTISQFQKPGTHKTYSFIQYKKAQKIISEDVSENRYFVNNQPKSFLNILFDRYIDYYNKKPYKEIIIDEGQDISEDMLTALLKITDHISIFADNHQKINDKGTSIETMKKILSPEGEVEELTLNMRTTKEIFEYAAETFLPDDEQIQAMRTAKTCKSIPESKPDNENSRKFGNNDTWYLNVFAQIKENINQFKNILVVCPGKVEIKKMSGILSANKIYHGVYYSGIEREGVKNEYAVISGMNTSQNILITTYISAKGLEAECVIIYISQKEWEKFNNGEFGDQGTNIFYTLSTRPRKKLLFATNFSLNDN